MTIKELKKLLKGLPGNTLIYLDDPKSLYFEHIDKVLIERINTDRSTYVVLCTDSVNCK